MAKKRKPWSRIVNESGTVIRLYERLNGRAVYFSYVDSDGRKVQKSTKRTDRTQAETVARDVVKLRIEDRLLGRTRAPTLGTIFKLWALHRAPRLRPEWKKAGETRRDLFEAAWGASMNVEDIGQHQVDQYGDLRRSGQLSPFTPGEKGQQPRPVSNATVAHDLSWLSSVFNFARRFKLDGRRVLTLNPLHDCSWPREKNPKRPVASHARYLETLKHADTVDPEGRLRCALALARHTGRRESAILKLRAADVLRSAEDVRAALAALGQDERRADHWPLGALRWRAESDKGGRDLVAPLSKAVREELDRYLKAHPRIGEAWLFPAPGRPKEEEEEEEEDDEPQNEEQPPEEKHLRRDLAGRWLLRAEALAELPKLAGGRWHPYRRLWATERKDMPDADVAAAGGWKDTRALKLSYQHADPATMLRVVEGG